MMPGSHNPGLRGLYSILVVFYVMVLSCSTSDRRLRIAVASNAQYAGHELVAAFENKTGISCDLIIGSSGKISAQILSGAPFDVFLSADTSYIHHLLAEGMVRGESRLYAEGQLVLWTADKKLNPGLDILLSDAIEHIALPNPDLAPYGAAAELALRKIGIYEEIQPKLVFGESIAQTNQFIVTGSADIGFTAKSVVMAPTMMKQGKWSPVNPSLYPYILQSAAMIQSGHYEEEASSFFSFLFSSEGQDILKKFGYDIPQVK